MKRQCWIGVGALLLVAPIATGLSGCNGDNESGGVTVPTPTPTEVAARSISAPISLGVGKSGLLTLLIQGSRATGSLKVSNSAPALRAAKSAEAITFSIPNAAYGVSGTFTPPRTFSVIGAFPPPLGAFTINGTLPTATQAGSFTLRANGQTASATIPPTGAAPTPTATGANPTPTATGANPTPTATTRPSATATPVPPGSGTNLIFTPASGYNGIATPFTRVESTPSASLVNQPSSGLLNAVVSAGNATTGARTFTIQAFRSTGPVAVGTTFVGNGSGDSLNMRYSENRPTNNNFVGTWNSTTGTAQVTALTANSITLRFTTVHFEPFVFGAGNAQGDFTLNGTLTFPISRN